ncbi:hypothetical protein LOK49_LG15G00072 [Camellia lanceoleosa]|uniref:Uncharacterized protein n=1 Tax=Camellia lanceoleosa TaxID=1840588 RepID=A0ACC0F4X9_9ERIC|nr:hypothetical protein LOK49_LG15G00072 [Camellia lanceoleosa]
MAHCSSDAFHEFQMVVELRCSWIYVHIYTVTQEGEGWIETDNNGNGNGGRKGNLVSGKQQYYDYIWRIVGAEDENSPQLWRIADRWIWH